VHEPLTDDLRVPGTDIALTGSGTLDAGVTSTWNKGSDRAYLESLIAQGITDPRTARSNSCGSELTGTHPRAFGPFAITRSCCTRAPRLFDVSGLTDDHIQGLRDRAFGGVTDATNRFADVDGLRLAHVTVNGVPMTGQREDRARRRG
jgi:hypothetical protein